MPDRADENITSSLSRFYKRLPVDADAMTEAFRTVPSAAGRQTDSDFVRLNVSSHSPEGITEWQADLALDEVRRYSPTKDNLHATYYFPGERAISVSMGPIFNWLEVRVESRSPAEVQAVFAMIEEQLGLELAEAEAEQEGAETDLTRAIRCFLSSRFNDADEPLARKVKRFLEAAGCEVITGAQYTPASLSQNIRELINSDLDLAVVLIGPSGPSAWTRDEMTRAATLGVPVVPLVSSSQKFDAGIFGDLQWVGFDGDCVADTFTDLLQAVRYVKDRRSRETGNAAP